MMEYMDVLYAVAIDTRYTDNDVMLTMTQYHAIQYTEENM